MKYLLFLICILVIITVFYTFIKNKNIEHLTTVGFIDVADNGSRCSLSSPNTVTGNYCLYDDTKCFNLHDQCGILESDVDNICGNWEDCGGVICGYTDGNGESACLARKTISSASGTRTARKKVLYGCTDSDYSEYDSNADTDDGTCSTLVCNPTCNDGFECASGTNGTECQPNKSDITNIIVNINNEVGIDLEEDNIDKDSLKTDFINSGLPNIVNPSLDLTSDLEAYDKWEIIYSKYQSL